MPSALIQTYVDRAIARMRRLDFMRWPGKPPAEMLDPTIKPSDDWVGWKPVPSTVTDADLDGLERETKLAFPPLYRDFLKYLHFVELEGVGFSFERHILHEWKKTLRKKYFQGWPRERILDVGLIPFGDECQMDAGPICFDTRKRLPDGDYPVVFWDREWVNTKQEIKPLFSSGSKMFECLAFATSTDLNLVTRLEDDDDQVLKTKAALLKEFLAIDPEGAGGVAREYWEAWTQ